MQRSRIEGSMISTPPFVPNEEPQNKQRKPETKEQDSKALTHGKTADDVETKDAKHTTLVMMEV